MKHNPQIADQYLLWALEEINHPQAEHYIRLALRELIQAKPQQPSVQPNN